LASCVRLTWGAWACRRPSRSIRKFRLAALLDELLTAVALIDEQAIAYAAILAAGTSGDDSAEPWESGASLLAESVRKLRSDLEQANAEFLRAARDPRVREFLARLNESVADPRD
jgi:hypothetical protein